MELNKLIEVDNLDLLLPFIKPESDDDFYYLQILQRKKENPQLGRNSRVIKNYYIKSQEELIKKYDEIKDLCRLFNARASLRLNKRSFEKVAFKSLENIAHNMSQRDFVNISHGYDRACGLGHNESRGNTKWILDIDDVSDFESMAEMNQFIFNIEPVGQKVLAHIPSKTGYHLITAPFNSQVFSQQYPDVDIHRDNPSNLFLLK